MDSDLLRVYYTRLFPCDSFCRWLSGYGVLDKSRLLRREFSFTLKDDIYIRYLCFSSPDELRNELLRRLPHKIDIGAVFNARPSDHNKISEFQPVGKELVFDIDLTDYDEVRFCCQQAKVCQKCMGLMRIAVKIIDQALRKDFGFEDLLWVFSGRRGVHCWVSDASAVALGATARSAVAEYLQLVSGGDSRAKKVALLRKEIHPSIQRALDIIDEHFEQTCLLDQDILGDEQRCKKVLALVPNEELCREMEEAFRSQNDSLARWKVMELMVGEHVKKRRGNTKVSMRVLDEIKLQYAYPRLDINVSKGLNHLLKSPFCVHPKTGKVCVPFDARRVASFDFLGVPTITQLMDEIDAFAVDEQTKKKGVSKDYKKTSLREAMAVFDEFLANLAQHHKGRLIAQSDAAMAF